MDPKPAIFIVYIWRLPEGFKASARAADSEETRQFERAEELLRYLRGPAPVDSGGPTGGGEYERLDK
jgi:hypothetical protein